ncbi:hypothetical protein EDC94DRAFT_617238 [Helicostylum pulchrum]|nr:hypothetical protein EDC94DRAFT_617238 [Helicostylum pulchrum]
MTFQQLPFEIRQNIFQYVLSSDETSLKNCSAVCRAWFRDTVFILRETVTVSGNPSTFLSILSNQTEERNFNKYVKTLRVVHDSRYKGVNVHGQILHYFPSLRELDLSQSSNKFFFLESIAERYTDNNIPSLEKIVVGGGFSNQSQYKTYFDCVYSLRHTLPYLELSNLAYYVLHCNKSLSLIKDFTELTELSIKNMKEDAADKNFRMFPILELIPNITRFSIENEFEERKNVTVTRSSSASSLYPNLKDAKFRVMSFTAFHMKYVLSYFPKNLKTFSLTITKVKAEDWIQKNDRALVQSFAAYLGRTQNICFSFARFAVTLTDTDTIQSVFTPNILNTYWSLIFDIAGQDSQLSCHVSVRLDESFDPCFQNTDSLLIKRNKRNLYLSYILDINNLMEQNPQSISTSIDNLIPIPPHSPGLNKSTIGSIEILSKPPFSPPHYIQLDESIRLLKSALQEYPRLSYLHFAQYCNYHERYNFKFGYKLEDIEEVSAYEDHIYYDTHSFDLAGKRFKRLSTPTKKNLTFALIEVSWLVAFNLNVIIGLLPNIEYLNINKCDMRPEPDLSNLLDLQYMYKLKTLVFDIGFLRNDLERKIIVRIEYKKNNTSRCYLWRKVHKLLSQFKTEKFELISADYLEKTNWLGKQKVDTRKAKILLIKCYDVDEIKLVFENRAIGKFMHPSFLKK